MQGSAPLVDLGDPPMRRPAHRALTAAALLASFLAVAFPGAALATDEPVDQLMTYRGSLTLDSSDGFTFDVTAELTVDCSDPICTALVEIVDGDFVASPSSGQAVPIDDEIARAELPEFGDLCALRWIGAGSLTIAFDGDAAELTRTIAAGGPTPCPSGAQATAAAATLTGTLTLVTGATCLLTAECGVFATPTAIPTPTATAAAAAAAEPTVGELIPWPDTPSVLSTLMTTSEALSLDRVLRSAVGALILTLLIAFPAVLLDASATRVMERIEQRRLARRGERREPWQAPPLTVLGAGPALLGLVVAAVASAFVDPDFGFDPTGIRTTLAIFAAFVVTVALGWAVVATVMALAARGSRPRVEFRPLSLIIVVAGVVISRLTGFEPGVIFGLIAGIGFGAILSDRVRATSSFIGLGFLAIVGGASWIGYSAWSSAGSAAPEWYELLGWEALAGITIAAASALPIALLPVRGLLGADVWAWNRIAWLASYLLASAAFLLVLIPLPDSWDALPVDTGTWAIGYAAFPAASIVAWLVTRGVVRSTAQTGNRTTTE